MDKQEKRIAQIFGTKKVPDVTEKTLGRYLAYLKQHVEFPCRLTGIQDFDWEEYYVFGPGSKEEYKELRKTRPSYQDAYEVLGFEDEFDEDYGLYVKVKRISDQKKFVLPLADLEATDKKSKNYQLLNDFSVWFVNYR